MATFLANEINATDRDVTGLIEQVQIIQKYQLMMQGIWSHFFWDVDE